LDSGVSFRQESVGLNKWSSLLPVTSGVPQGSILGPLLFLVFVNDLPTQTINHSKTVLFADDTKCSRSVNSKSDMTLLQGDLNALHDWCNEWHMSFNVSKCVFMTFSTSTPAIISNYSLASEPVRQVSEYKDLGPQMG